MRGLWPVCAVLNALYSRVLIGWWPCKAVPCRSLPCKRSGFNRQQGWLLQEGGWQD
jgi:hypothetical protein